MKILIICKNQFGYHIDTWYYCKNLQKDNEVAYLGFDFEKKKYHIDGVNTVYVSRRGSFLSRQGRFLKLCQEYIKNENPDVVFIKYFAGCSLLKILVPRVKFIFDIRTGDVSRFYWSRLFKDVLMSLESVFFDNISIISESLRQKLRYPKTSYILPLGAEIILPNSKSRDVLSMVYVGTLTGRNLEKTIYGLELFVKENKGKRIEYTIVGDGWGDELKKLKNLVASLHLNDYIKLTGFLHHTELRDIISTANVGVSFVPKTSYFDNQPVTKTFEYLLAGLPVIATSTSENLKVVNSSNGFLIDDDAESFCEAIAWAFDYVLTQKVIVHPEDYKNFSWQYIVGDLGEYLRRVVTK